MVDKIEIKENECLKNHLKQTIVIHKTYILIKI